MLEIEFPGGLEVHPAWWQALSSRWQALVRVLASPCPRLGEPLPMCCWTLPHVLASPSPQDNGLFPGYKVNYFYFFLRFSSRKRKKQA